jgi:hypothetical protein
LVEDLVVKTGNKIWPGPPVSHGPTQPEYLWVILEHAFLEVYGMRDVHLPAMRTLCASFLLSILPQMDNTLFEGNVLKVNRARRQAPREPRSYDNGGGGGGGGYYQRGGGGGYNGEGSRCCLWL